MIKIAELGNAQVKVSKTENDNTVSIADLAMYVEFDPDNAKRYDTSIPVVAYEALEDEYGAFEKVDGGCDYYIGAWMSFKDGSEIIIRNE